MHNFEHSNTELEKLSLNSYKIVKRLKKLKKSLERDMIKVKINDNILYLVLKVQRANRSRI